MASTSLEVSPPEYLPQPIADFLNWMPDAALSMVLAIAIVLIGWYVARTAMRFAGRSVARRFERPSITRAVLQVIRASVFALALAVAAVVLGISPGELLLSVTVFSAVLAVVLAPVVRRFVGGMFVLADQPFEIGDMIEIVDTDTRGFVEDMTFRYTKMFTLQNTFLVISNSEILERDIINYSAEDKRTRQEIQLIVTYEGDLDEARRLAEEAAKEVEEVIKSGPSIRVGSTRFPAEPTTYIDEFGDHGVTILLRYWVKNPYYLASVRSRVQTRFWEKIADAPVEIAYPHNHLIFDETSGELAVDMGEHSPESRSIGRDNN